MIQRSKIEIKYFRSIYKATIEDLRDVVVFAGKNDCGKTNIIRALNLFFNNQTGWNESLNFDRDFCRKRLSECRATIKAKQFIQVKIHFVRGDRYDKSLPHEFWVSRTWTRDAKIPSEQDSLRENETPTKRLDRAQASMQRYLSSIRIEYVPAVKDRSFFNYSLGILQEAILQSKQNQHLKEAVQGLNTTVKNEAKLLHEEFEKVSGVNIQIHLPENIEELFRAFSVSTGGNDGMPLGMRGDGIQARFLPSLIHHVASRSNRYFIWGFEEPENCLEHGLATKLADDVVEQYSQTSQIILSSHSPAFITLTGENTSVFRTFTGDDKQTATSPISSTGDILSEDLGLAELQRQYQAAVKKELEVIRLAKETLADKLTDATSPVLLVEGKTDVLILSEAWKRLYDKPMPFRIISANTASDSDPDSKAGSGVLRKAIESCRKDSPKTIGLFDQDEQGLSEFKLDKNFKQSEDDQDIKISTNQHVACILLPAPAGKKAYQDAGNLCIEFLFPENCITQLKEGKGLELSQKEIIARIGSRIVSRKQTKEMHERKIDNGKTFFASKIVPSFSDTDFGNFKPLFEKAINTFEALQ